MDIGELNSMCTAADEFSCPKTSDRVRPFGDLIRRVTGTLQEVILTKDVSITVDHISRPTEFKSAWACLKSAPSFTPPHYLWRSLGLLCPQNWS